MGLADRGGKRGPIGFGTALPSRRPCGSRRHRAWAAETGSGPPVPWDHYRGEIFSVAAVVVLQTLLISVLLFERRRRSFAEAESRRRLLEVAHLNRAATVSAMSASITHEINQPLGAILSNAEAAEELIKSDRFDRAELAAILADIRRDDQRAAEIIRSMRGLLRRSEIVSREFDLNDCIRDALGIIGPEARSRRVALTADQESGVLPVRADPVHLQQVVFNLAINGMDAMQNGPPDGRAMEIRTARTGTSEVTVTVSDTGTGIPARPAQGHFRAVLHDQGAGHRPRPLHRPHDRENLWRKDLGGKPAGRRGGVSFHPAAGEPQPGNAA